MLRKRTLTSHRGSCWDWFRSVAECRSRRLGSCVLLEPRWFRRSGIWRIRLSPSRMGTVRSGNEMWITSTFSWFSFTHLLNCWDGNVAFESLLGTRFGEIVVDAAGAEDDALDAAWILRRFSSVWDDSGNVLSSNYTSIQRGKFLKTHRKNSVPSDISENELLASGCLSKLFGVIKINGFLNGIAICLRRMWK